MKRIAFYFIGGCCIISSFIGFSQYGIATGIIMIVLVCSASVILTSQAI